MSCTGFEWLEIVTRQRIKGFCACVGICACAGAAQRLTPQHHDLWAHVTNAVFACADLAYPPRGMRLHGPPGQPSDIAKALQSFLTCVSGPGMSQ